MTKFNLKAVNTYQRQKELMDSIEHLIEHKLEPVDTIEAMNVLMQHRPIWTVEDVSNGKKDYRLVYYVLTPALDLFRITGIPGESKEKDEHLKINEMNLVDLAKATWYVESEVLYKMKTAKSESGEDSGEVALKSVTKAPSDTAKKDVEGRDYILMYSDMAEEDRKVRVGASVFIPKLPNGGGGGHYIVQRILGKDAITIHDMEDITESFQVNYQKVTREDVKNEWFMSEEPSNIGREIVGVEVIENYFHDPRYLIYLKDEVFVTLPNEGRDHLPKSGKYEVEPQKTTVIKFASPEEIVAYVTALNLDRNQKETFRVAIHMKDITPVKAQEQEDENNG